MKMFNNKSNLKDLKYRVVNASNEINFNERVIKLENEGYDLIPASFGISGGNGIMALMVRRDPS